MKRSEINAIIRDGMEFIRAMKVALPPFAYWTPDDWRSRGPEYDEIRQTMLGWDVTDFGTDDFRRVGLLIFTLRNGSLSPGQGTKPYCEKLLVVEEGQVLPAHFHHMKIEDIINRGGGDLLVELHNADGRDGFADTSVQVSMDGRRVQVAAGQTVRLTPGESITLLPRQYHAFYAAEGTGRVLLGEVSTVNDDRVDNHFHDYSGRLPQITEDDTPAYLLFGDDRRYHA